MSTYNENCEAAFASSFSGTVPRWQRKAMQALPGACSPQADRFIPSRSSTSADEGHFHLTNSSCTDEVSSPSTQDYQRTMASNLFPDNGNNKVLAFSQAAPKPQDGYQGDMRVLYSSQSRGSVRKTARFIPQAADRILDAPDLRSDFYLNTLDWSASNVVAIALGQV